MAMVECPTCGKSISDKAPKCPFCGYIRINGRHFCAECGAELDEGTFICTKCGCPAEIQHNAGEAKYKKKSLGIIVAITVLGVFALILAIIVIIRSFQLQQKQNALSSAEQVIKEYEERENERINLEIETQHIAKEYAENLELITYTMLSGCADAETCGNLIIKVWHNAIYETIDPETDNYTRSNGQFVSDFNIALNNLFSDPDFANKISNIRNNQATALSLMKKLKNPPSEYAAAYDTLSKYYDAYIEFTDLVIECNGSLKTFSEAIEAADIDFIKYYKAMQIYLGD